MFAFLKTIGSAFHRYSSPAIHFKPIEESGFTLLSGLFNYGSRAWLNGICWQFNYRN
jgi:hypothetical protein